MHCSQHTLLAEDWLFDGTEDLDTDSAGTTALAAHFFSTVPPPPAPFLPPESSTLSAHSLICNKNKVSSSWQQKNWTFKVWIHIFLLLTLSNLSLSKSARKGFTAFSPTTFMAVPRASKAASRTSGAESFTCCEENIATLRISWPDLQCLFKFFSPYLVVTWTKFNWRYKCWCLLSYIRILNIKQMQRT